MNGAENGAEQAENRLQRSGVVIERGLKNQAEREVVRTGTER